jgi:LacI family transcriptional regulator
MTIDDSAQDQRPGPQAASAKQVAELAGVSLTTVSRVLRGRGADAISPVTRQRVIAAAAEVGYRPNGLALALRRGVTETIGLIVPDISDAYFHQIARGVEDVVQRAGYGLLLTNTDRVPEREVVAVNMLLDKRVDGVIFAGGGISGDAHLDAVAWGRTRVVVIGPHDLDAPAVRVDDAAAIQEAVGYLAGLGRARILCLAGREDWLVSRDRLAGYRKGVRGFGLVADDALISFGGFGRADATARVRNAIAAGVAFDGVVAFNDYCAIGALAALREAGLEVPRDVAVIGCDDIPEAELMDLSSISFSQYEMGRAAAELLLSDPAAAPPATHPHTLAIRGSTGGT